MRKLKNRKWIIHELVHILHELNFQHNKQDNAELSSG